MAEVLKFNVEFVDGRTMAAAFTPKVQVAVERQFSMSAADISRMEHICFAAYVGLQQKGELSGVQFDEFLDQVVSVEPDEESEQVDPTQPAPSTEGSSS